MFALADLSGLGRSTFLLSDVPALMSLESLPRGRIVPHGPSEIGTGCDRPFGRRGDGDRCRAARGPKHFTEDWRARQGAGPLVFRLEWIRFLSERETPLGDLTTAWQDSQRVAVGTVTFPKTVRRHAKRG
jgi:hypothetical protein